MLIAVQAVPGPDFTVFMNLYTVRKSNESYTLVQCSEPVIIGDDYICYRISEISSYPVENMTVYNLTVKDDNTHAV